MRWKLYNSVHLLFIWWTGPRVATWALGGVLSEVCKHWWERKSCSQLWLLHSVWAEVLWNSSFLFGFEWPTFTELTADISNFRIKMTWEGLCSCFDSDTEHRFPQRPKSLGRQCYNKNDFPQWLLTCLCMCYCCIKQLFTGFTKKSSIGITAWHLFLLWFSSDTQFKPQLQNERVCNFLFSADVFFLDK